MLIDILFWWALVGAAICIGTNGVVVHKRDRRLFILICGPLMWVMLAVLIVYDAWRKKHGE